MQCAVNLQPLQKNDALSREVDNIMCTQNEIVKKLERLETRMDNNFFLQGNEVKKTQEAPRKLEEAVNVLFKRMESYVVKATQFLAHSRLESDHVTVRHMHLLHAIKIYLYQLGTLNTNLKTNCASLFVYKI